MTLKRFTANERVARVLQRGRLHKKNATVSFAERACLTRRRTFGDP
jgi:hypothetical protein